MKRYQPGPLAVILAILIICAAGCLHRPPEPYRAHKDQTPRRGADSPFINSIDGAQLIRIPEGSFVMGLPGRDGRKINLEEFYIYKYEVTNRQFRKFVDATGYKAEGNWDKWMIKGTDDYPVVMVSWNDAMAYCRWAKVSLPTEAQWEKAARGDGGRIYPWGDDFNPAFCNNSRTPPHVFRGKTRMLYENTGITPVGFFTDDKSPYGVMDMGGNVCEWTADWFSDKYPEEDGIGHETGTDKVLKGGSFYKAPDYCRTFFRDDNLPSASDTDYGFRCVRLKENSENKDRLITENPPATKPEKPINPDSFANTAKIINSRNVIDGAEVILIPAGPFTMGALSDDKDARPQEKPARRVYLDAYYIYRNEVTYGQFRKFADSTGYRAEGPWRSHYKKELENHPVVYVTWNDAMAYCRWAGGSLPTEARWEKAARGPKGNLYAWGNRWNPDFANVLETKDRKILAMRHIYYDNLGTVPVGALPEDCSFYGLMDVTGNVIEWCRDWYDGDYYKKGPVINPQGPSGGAQKIMRGGGWGQDRRICRLTYRDRERPGDVDGDFGFRCVIEADLKKTK